MKQTVKAIFATILICVSCFYTSGQAVTLPETAKIIPPETVLLIDVDDFTQLKQQFEKTNFYKLYKDPAMASFFDGFKAKISEKVQELDENDIFKAFYNTDVLPQGRVSFALVLNEQTKDSDTPPILFISQWGENIAKIQEAVKKMVEKNIELGGHQKGSENYRGVSIETSIDEDSLMINYCFIDDCFIIATNVDILKFTIAHIQGATSPTLAGDFDYTSTMKTIGPYHDIDFYVNIKHIIKMLLIEDTNGQAQTIISNLGFDNVPSIGYSIGPARCSPNHFCGKVFLKINGPKKGICKMLEAESTVFTAPPFLSTSTSSVMFYNLDIKKAFNELANILNSLSPQAAAIMYMPLLPPSPEGEPAVQLKNDIIDHLGSQIVITESVDKPLSADSTPQNLITFAVNNRTALEKSLSLLHSKMIAPNNPESKRELLGHTIYVLDVSAVFPFIPGQRTPLQTPPTTQAPQMPKFALTVTDTHLIFATEAAVEQAIRKLSSPSVSTSPATWFIKAKSTIPSVVGLACLEDTSVSFELLWKMAKKAAEKNQTTPMGAKPGISFYSTNPISILTQMGFNFDSLPDFEAVRKYFGLFTSYGISRPDGFFFEFKEINPN